MPGSLAEVREMEGRAKRERELIQERLREMKKKNDRMQPKCQHVGGYGGKEI